MSKSIYTFTINKVAKVSEKRSEKYTDKEGNEKERTITEEVEKNIPIEILIKKPNRRQLQEADMVFSVEMSRCIKAGILTKNMLLNKYTDTGGLVSREDNKVLNKAKDNLESLERNLVTLLAIPEEKRNAEEKEEISNLESDIFGLRRKIIESQVSYLDLFNHTADTKAQNRIVLWYVLNLSFFKDPASGHKDFMPIFEGDTFEEKEAFSYELEEREDFLFVNAYDKIAKVLSFWYFTGITDVELIEQSLKEQEKENEELLEPDLDQENGDFEKDMIEEVKEE